MKAPTQHQMTDFIKREFLQLEFDEIRINKVRDGNCSFDVILDKKSIASSYEYCEYFSEKYYWERIKNRLGWSLNRIIRDKTQRG